MNDLLFFFTGVGSQSCMKVLHTLINVRCLVPKFGRRLSWSQLREISFCYC